jgi:hypothetical protein
LRKERTINEKRIHEWQKIARKALLNSNSMSFLTEKMLRKNRLTVEERPQFQ